MIVKLMGFLDFLGAIFLLLLQFEIINPFFRPMVAIGIYLIGKGILFRGDFPSIIDFFSGIYFFLAFFGLRTFIAYIIVLFLLQKAFFSIKS